MSVVIVGGNECMVGKYKQLCKAHGCQARVYPKLCGGLKKIGNPDLLVLFTNTVSHTMVRCALREARAEHVRIARCHSSSMSALRNVLEEHTKEGAICPKN